MVTYPHHQTHHRIMVAEIGHGLQVLRRVELLIVAIHVAKV